MSHFFAFVLGVVAATAGFTGMAQIADRGVDKMQIIVKENAR